MADTQQLDLAQVARWILKDKYQEDPTKITQIAVEEVRFLEKKQVSDHPVGKDLEAFIKGEPLAYIIGWVSFLGSRIELQYRTLIPRPETEYWVGQTIGELKTAWRDRQNSSAKPRVLDLCCGSGCIGIAVLSAFPEVELEFADISPAAVAQTHHNLKINELNATKVVQSDLFDQLGNTQYDVILSNPPYIAPDGDFSVEILHEPSEALFTQKNGLEMIERIILSLEKHLKPTGLLVMEFGKRQEHEIEKMLEAVGKFRYQFCADQFGVKRYVKVQRVQLENFS